MPKHAVLAQTVLPYHTRRARLEAEPPPTKPESLLDGAIEESPDTVLVSLARLGAVMIRINTSYTARYPNSY